MAVSTARGTRVRIGGALLVGALAAGISMLVIAIGDRSCQTARATVRDIGEHWELLDPRGIAPGGSELGEYRARSQRLQGYAARVGEPVLKSQLEHIAALSARRSHDRGAGTNTGEFRRWRRKRPR
ncbi:hypothetical protein ACT17_08240 [Mycolicibacterium conceptionense]|uniref:Uncharacterized protein n=1 Tax=Mycolicibacterium conceptionense TaxID=451644 RepID=A0A0J8UBZ8_9MYCO|nr:hypothetical protein ACT17_08240 [Mycolicibacterium conceptionense]